MPFEETIRQIRDSDWYGGQIVSALTLPGEEAVYSATAAPLSDAVVQYFGEAGIRLYSHQAQAVDLIRQGVDLFIATPAASGKTLAFNLPVLESMIDDDEATGLYIYPTKALTNDQLLKLKELQRGIGFPLATHVYDGDTPGHARARIRSSARIVLTNPYALHFYLPWHARWATFLERLKYVVIDEAHHYRGVFGSQVALLIRRLRRILARYGADPTFILASATLANPTEFGERLVGKTFSLVSTQGAPRGPRTFLLWNAMRSASELKCQVSDLVSGLIGQGLQTLCFTPTRGMAEICARMTQDKTPGRRIMAYRAGYLPDDRREIEEGLRSGSISGVISTNALELGVDIGGLDAVVIVGYPGTVMSLWQQAGRAGRGSQPSLVVFMGLGDPLDQYFLARPSDLLARPQEHAIIEPTNLAIQTQHLLCASAELPVRQEDLMLFGADEAPMKALQEEDLVAPTPAGWVYQGSGAPVNAVSLNNLSARTIRVECEGKLLENLDYQKALEEVHPCAVLFHLGDTYVVERLDLDLGVAFCVRRDVDYHTHPVIDVQVSIRGADDAAAVGGFKVSHGDVRVREHVVRYGIIGRHAGLAYEPLDLPPVEYETEGIWIEVPEDIRREGTTDHSEAHWNLYNGLVGAEHALFALAPLHTMTDRRDLGSVSYPLQPDIASPAIIVYEAFPYGIGITRKLLELRRDWFSAALALAQGCPCSDGCPSCIYIPRRRWGNSVLSKAGAVVILSLLCRAASEARHSQRPGSPG